MRSLLLAVSFVVAGCATDGMAPSRPSERAKAAQIQAELASRYLQAGRLDLARDRVNRALELAPELPSTHTVAAVLAEKVGDREGAERHYSRAVQSRGSGGAERNNYGQYLCGLERYQEAEEQFDAALKDAYYANLETAAVNAGICAQRSGDLARAERFLTVAIERKPTMPEALISMAIVQHALGKHLRARAFLQRFEATGSVSSEALALGYRVESALAARSAAEDYRQRLLREFPGSEQAEVLKE